MTYFGASTFFEGAVVVEVGSAVDFKDVLAYGKRATFVYAVGAVLELVALSSLAFIGLPKGGTSPESGFESDKIAPICSFLQ